MKDYLKSFTVIFLLIIILWGFYDKATRKTTPKTKTEITAIK